MRCCAACFGDRGLARSVIPFLSGTIADCPTCLTRQVIVVDAFDLREHFELVASAYQRDDAGRPLLYWFTRDWALFSHPKIQAAEANGLISAIFADERIAEQNFLPLWEDERRGLSEWESLREELMHHNRFFPQSRVDLDSLGSLLAFLTLEDGEFPTKWFRARLLHGVTSYSLDEMGAPPPSVASHGRANPAGIRCLYLASSIDGAIAEVRPHTGELASVATFELEQGLKLVDLQRPRRTVSPFLLDVDDIARMRNDLVFLERLGQELTRPVLPYSAAVDYTPSQYLCEFIKRRGYDGVLYRSSVSRGFNLALFSPERAQANSVKRFRIERASVKIRSF